MLWRNEQNSFILRKVIFELFTLSKALALAWKFLEEFAWKILLIYTAQALFTIESYGYHIEIVELFTNKISALFQPQAKMCSLTSP